jgi:hypothetical protein
VAPKVILEAAAMTLPVIRPRTHLALGATLPVDEPYGFVAENVRAIPSLLDLSGLRGKRAQLARHLVRGPYRVSGTIELRPGFDEVIGLVPRILGGECQIDSPPGFTGCHIGETIPDFHLMIDRGAKVYTYSGCKLVRADFVGRPGRPLTLTLHVEGLTESVAAAGTFPSLSYNPGPPLVFAGAELVLHDFAREMQSATVSLENIAILDRFVNSLTRVDLPIVDRRVRLFCALDYSSANHDLYAIGPVPASASVRFLAGGRELTFKFHNLKCQAPSPHGMGPGELLLELQGQASVDHDDEELVVNYSQ